MSDYSTRFTLPSLDSEAMKRAIDNSMRTVREALEGMRAINDLHSRARRREHWTEQDSLDHMARMGRVEMNAARHHLNAEVARVRKELGL